ncbi:MAG TPA: metallophosphoesterase [Acidimicrobiales bacterium]|nr:metallophosphoesterase [Acidimicrobiales bacterium]
MSDVVDELLCAHASHGIDAELVVSCGDLPNEYLEYLVAVTGVPLVYVPGNHDGRQGPSGCTNIDGRVEDILGLRVGGLGGSMRYRDGPHQYTERQMARRARRLVRAAGHLDVFVAHSPPAGAGDEPDDVAHRGFASFLDVIDHCHPKVMLYGHVPVYGPRPLGARRGTTLLVNAIPHREVRVAA